MRRPRHHGRSLGSGLVALLFAALLTPTPAPADDFEEAQGRLYLVTLDGPGTAGYDGPLPDLLMSAAMRARQSSLLARVDAPTPTYRWTTALNGFAVHLTRAQAGELETEPSVESVEPNRVRPLASTTTAGGADVPGPRRGGAGTVIGVIDTGIAPDSLAFTGAARLGREPRRFRGPCADGDGWDSGDCGEKVVGARWFVDGFGEGNLRSNASLSPRDTDGHGTQMASIAAGNPEVPVRVGGQGLGRHSGTAPQARIAAYKACWAAPDPTDDGCASADLVTAIDRATADSVDVISLAIGGPAEIDTVERALLGAAEAGIVVTAAAGNTGTKSYAAHPSPWVVTVGATNGVPREGRVVPDSDGPPVTGAMISTRGVPPSRVVLGARVPAKGATSRDARVCAPGSLDAGRVAGAIVLCERGRVGRVDKSRAVRLADGVGMVLVNVAPGGVANDFHSVPTVHVAERQGQVLRRWVARHPAARVALRPVGVVRAPRRVAPWSSTGSTLVGVLKPDLSAPGAGVLGAVPDAQGWDFVTGTSAATAYTAGVAATLLAHTGWEADAVRSALVTTARSLSDSVLRTGAGRLRPDQALRPGLVHEVGRGDFRDWLEGRTSTVNIPSVLLAEGQRRTRRSITNQTDRTLYFSSHATGFRRDVVVRPAAVRLAPGESATYTIVVRDAGSRSDDGHVVWRGATGTVTRVPVQIAR